MTAKQKGKSRRTKAKATGGKAGVVDTGHQLWLAGLGALARTQSEGPKLFASLVAEGNAVQARQRENTQRFVNETWQRLRDNVQARVEDVHDKASETLENLEQIFQSRVKKALQQLGVPTSDEIQELSSKVSQLNRSVQKLTRSSSELATNQDQAAGDERAVL